MNPGAIHVASLRDAGGRRHSRESGNLAPARSRVHRFELISIQNCLFLCINLAMKVSDHNIAALIRQKIQSVDLDAEVILFGSRAKGTANENSDWDILVLVKKPLSSRLEERKYRNAVFDLELEIEQPISVMVLSKNEWNKSYIYTSLYNSVKTEGLIL